MQGRFMNSEAGSVPVPDHMKPATGIFLGGCVRVGDVCELPKGRRGGPAPLAHAHTGGEFKGWICFQLPEYFYGANYHHLRMHELAHIISGEGHTDRWRRALEALGEEVPAHHQPRRRKKATPYKK